MFRAHRSCWAHLIPTASSQTAVLAEHFFNCACSLMARQLRETVENSLADLVTFLALYKVIVCVDVYQASEGHMRQNRSHDWTLNRLHT